MQTCQTWVYFKAHKLGDYQLDTITGTWNPILGCISAKDVCPLDEHGKTWGVWDGKQCKPTEEGSPCRHENISGTFFKNECSFQGANVHCPEQKRAFGMKKTVFVSLHL